MSYISSMVAFVNAQLFTKATKAAADSTSMDMMPLAFGGIGVAVLGLLLLMYKMKGKKATTGAKKTPKKAPATPSLATTRPKRAAKSPMKLEATERLKSKAKTPNGKVSKAA